MLFKSRGCQQVWNYGVVGEDLPWAPSLRVLKDSIVKKSNILMQSFEKSNKCKKFIINKLLKLLFIF